MIRIALIDDNPSDINIGKHYVDTYFQNRPDAANMEISISSYMDGPSFLADFRPDDFDLILLDIYMPAMEGMDVAREVRRLDESVKSYFLPPVGNTPWKGIRFCVGLYSEASGKPPGGAVSCPGLRPSPGFFETGSTLRPHSRLRNPSRSFQPYSLHGLQRRQKRFHSSDRKEYQHHQRLPGSGPESVIRPPLLRMLPPAHGKHGLH